MFHMSLDWDRFVAKSVNLKNWLSNEWKPERRRRRPRCLSRPCLANINTSLHRLKSIWAKRSLAHYVDSKLKVLIIEKRAFSSFLIDFCFHQAMFWSTGTSPSSDATLSSRVFARQSCTSTSIKSLRSAATLNPRVLKWASVTTSPYNESICNANDTVAISIKKICRLCFLDYFLFQL